MYYEIYVHHPEYGTTFTLCKWDIGQCRYTNLSAYNKKLINAVCNLGFSCSCLKEGVILLNDSPGFLTNGLVFSGDTFPKAIKELSRYCSTHSHAPPLSKALKKQTLHQFQLFDAIKKNEAKEVKHLIGKYTKADRQRLVNDLVIDTPLIAAIKASDNIKIVHLLLAAGAEVDKTNYYGLTPLCCAILYCRVETFKILIAAKANFNTTYKKSPLLHLASKIGIEDIVNILLTQCQADVTQTDDERSTALIKACEFGYTNVARALLDRGADCNTINRYGNTALHYAAIKNNLESTQLLCDKGANVCVQNALGYTAINLSTEKKIKDLLKARQQKQLQGKFLSFAMGRHPRLGLFSPVQNGTNDDVMGIIAHNLFNTKV